MAFKYNRLNKDDVALLMVDHQSGLLSLVRDFSPDDFKTTSLPSLTSRSSLTSRPFLPPALKMALTDHWFLS